MGKEIRYKDENCLHEGVLAYREQFNLMPNKGFRRDIAATIVTYDDLLLWQELLANWGYWRDGKYHKRNPLDIKGLLTVFEFKQREAQRKKDEIQQRALQVCSRESLPRRSVGRVPKSRLPRVLERSSGWK